MGGVPLPFLKDVELHARLLVAYRCSSSPSWSVHRRLGGPIAGSSSTAASSPSRRRDIRPAVASAVRLRNSLWAEMLVALVYVVGLGVTWRMSEIAHDVPSWRGAAVDGIWRPTLAGWWLGLVSLPLFQFPCCAGTSGSSSGRGSSGRCRGST